ncbi:MAG: thiamine-binding protein [Acidimicrobiia bacterium]|nr:thiamine-binding protein [Acidimicrobiia bacterium]MDH5521253.1 thiamine-binding protein [Acidimicrobiia bacterium]
MAGARVEVLVQPFKENDPGPHVTAAVDALRSAGLDPDMGPFATTAQGELDTVVETVATMLQVAFANGATSVHLQVDLTDDA